MSAFGLFQNYIFLWCRVSVLGFFEIDFHPFWPLDFNFDVFGFRNWDPLVIVAGLTSDLLKYLALPVWWVGRIASLDFHSRAHLPLGGEGVGLNAVWQILPLTADNGRDHLNRPFCGQYILADRFLRNSGYLVECEDLSTFGCQFPSKRSFEKSKILKFA